jgi:hypothetical protein
MGFSGIQKNDALAPKGIRRYHRQIGLVSLFTLTLLVAYHATTKWDRHTHKWCTNLTLKPNTRLRLLI